ncbi:MAG: hypothetical protein LQ338_007625 [Usnochroma carphineum]|nr:MAG: hypothetical protein LQ338_007625 [Usnochroma carphineum]
MVHFHMPSPKTNVTPEPDRRRAGLLSNSKLTQPRSPSTNDKAAMPSPVGSPAGKGSISRSGRSTPKPALPVTATESGSGLSTDSQTLVKALTAYTHSVIETSIVQSQCRTLSSEEKQIRDDSDRWSKYFDSYISMGEDQSRMLKATQTAKERAQGRLIQAKQASEQAMQGIVRSILAASAGKPTPAVGDDDPMEQLESKSLAQSKEIESLRQEIAQMRDSLVKATSNHHHIIEIADAQKRLEGDLSELWQNSLRKSVYRDAEARKEDRIADVSAKLKSLTSKWDDLGEDLADFRRARSDELNTAKLSKLESDLTASRKDLSALQEARVDPELVQGLEQTTASTRQALQELEIQRKAQDSRLQRLETSYKNDLEAKDEEQQALTQQARSICENSERILQSYTADSQQLRNEQQKQGLRCDSIEQMLEAFKQEPRSMPYGTADAEANMLDAAARLGGIEERLETMSQKMAGMQDEEERRDEAVGDQIDGFNDTLIKTEADFKNHEVELADLREQLASLKGQLNGYSGNQSANSTSLEEIKADIATLREDVKAVKDERTVQQKILDQLQFDVSHLRSQVSSQPPPQHSPASAINKIMAEVQPKIQALESRWRDTTDKLRAIESFLTTQESRWNNLTTEPMVKSVLHHMQQMYPLHLLQEHIQLKQRHDQMGAHFTQRMDSIQQSLGTYINKSSELDKAVKETKELLRNTKGAVERCERQNKETVEKYEREVARFDVQLDTHFTQRMDLIQQNSETNTKKFSELDEAVKETIELALITVKKFSEVGKWLKDTMGAVENSEPQNLRLDTHFTQRMGSIQQSLETYINKSSELNKAAEEPNELLLLIKGAFEKYDRQVAGLEKSIRDIVLRSQQKKEQDESSISAQDTATIQTIKAELQSLQTRHDAAKAANGEETSSELKTAIQNLQIKMNEQSLTQQLLSKEQREQEEKVKEVEEKVKEVEGEAKMVREESINELANLATRIEALEARARTEDDSRFSPGIRETHNKLFKVPGKVKKTRHEIWEHPSSDSDPAVDGRSNRSRTTHDSSKSVRKKRKRGHVPNGSDEGSARKTARDTPQQQQESPSSQPRRGRPRKTAD